MVDIYFEKSMEESTHGTGIRSHAHFGRSGMAKNFNAAKNDGVNIRFPAFKNSDSRSMSKHPGSMLNVHFITFSVVKRVEIYT